MKLTEETFLAQRKEVFFQQPAGAIDLQNAFDWQKSLPASKQFSTVLARAVEKGRVLTQPRGGVVLPEEQIALMKCQVREGQADLLTAITDSATNKGDLSAAQRLVEDSRRLGHSAQEGFPVTAHGVSGCRQVMEGVERPVQLRHRCVDARLLVETALAAGFTSIDGGGISHNLSYAKDVPLAQTLAHWQYCDRLIGEYAAAGILLNRETYGPLTGTLIPPFLSHAVSILEALLAAEQGVKCITLSYGQGGNLTQDVAAIRSLRQLAGEYLSKMGFSDVAVTVSLHQWMGGFPQEEAKAYGVISLGAVTAALGRADKVVTKTPMEAIGIPTPSAYAAGLSCTRQILSMLAEQPMPHSLAIEEESRLIGEEIRSIVDCVLQLGNGDVALGAAKGVEQGILDVPFSPSRQSAGRMLPARDNEGCVRIFEPGNLPFSKDILDFHRQKIEERAKAERRAPSFQMVIDDIYAVSNSRLVGRPR